MQTFNSFSQMATANTAQNYNSASPSVVTNNAANYVEPQDRDTISELLESTVKDVVQLKGLTTLCPKFSPIAKFEMDGDILRLKQVTLVNPDHAGDLR
jgi:hypothetical protein